jgi:hypothetical protein
MPIGGATGIDDEFAADEQEGAIEDWRPLAVEA